MHNLHSIMPIFFLFPGDNTAVSAKVFPRQQSSETSLSTENFTTPMRTHYPKLQLNR